MRKKLNKDIPPANSQCFDNPEKAGYLLRLTGKSLVLGGSWKKRYCLLDGTALYYYESKDSRGSEKSAGCVKLNEHTKCWAGDFNEYKKVTNVFIISGKQSKDVHYFAAETLSEMNDWIQKIQKVVRRAVSTTSLANKCDKKSYQKKTSPCIIEDGSLSDSQSTERLYGRGPMGLFSDCAHTSTGRLSQSTTDLVYNYSSSDDSLNNYSADYRKQWNLSFNKASVITSSEIKQETGSQICDLDIIHESPPEVNFHFNGDDFAPCKSPPKPTPPCIRKLNSTSRSKGFVTRGQSYDDKATTQVLYTHPDLLTGRPMVEPSTGSVESINLQMQLLDKQYKVLGANAVDSNNTLCASSAAESDVTFTPGVEPHRHWQKTMHILSSTIRDLTSRVQMLVQTVKHVDKDINISKRDIGSVQENLSKVIYKVQSAERKTSKMISSLIPAMGTIREVQDLSNKARRMIEEAEVAKKEYITMKDLYSELIRSLKADLASANEITGSKDSSNALNNLSSSSSSLCQPCIAFPSYPGPTRFISGGRSIPLAPKDKGLDHSMSFISEGMQLESTNSECSFEHCQSEDLTESDCFIDKTKSSEIHGKDGTMPKIEKDKNENEIAH